MYIVQVNVQKGMTPTQRAHTYKYLFTPRTRPFQFTSYAILSKSFKHLHIPSEHIKYASIKKTKICLDIMTLPNTPFQVENITLNSYMLT